MLGRRPDTTSFRFSHRQGVTAMRSNANRVLFAAMAVVVLLVVGGLAQAGGAGAAQAPKRADVLLPGDGAIGPAAFSQENPQIARGANGYLVVWEDSHTNYINLIDGVS